MTETRSQIDYIAYGPLDRMVTELGTTDPVQAGFMAQWQAQYAVTIVGAGDWDSEYFPNAEDAIAEAEYLAITYGVGTLAI